MPSHQHKGKQQGSNYTNNGSTYMPSGAQGKNSRTQRYEYTNWMQNEGSGTGHNHSHTLSGTLTGNVASNLTGSVTAAGTNSFSPFVVVNYIIKH
jgi:hypothetical protein